MSPLDRFRDQLTIPFDLWRTILFYLLLFGFRQQLPEQLDVPQSREPWQLLDPAVIE